ncbi:glutamine synthetase family protein [Dongia soli]|uniref:Glutamine synthetase family protein n=1 Tax=Dongia soli TaxID=600628 RepID=A0ABU5EGG0_9PROT|nr:glutamine synthetase family protein [Dongia soli]MDY0884977.1 glutamine synthetase family protein [Dongia soli]
MSEQGSGRETDLAIFLTNDLSGISRGRAFPLRDLADRRSSGVGWVPANLAITPFGSIGPNSFGPVGDLRLVPDLDDDGFRMPGVNGEPDLLGFLCNIVETDGTPWEGCSRGFAKRALADLEREFGFTIKASFEHEFFLTNAVLAKGAFTLADFRAVQGFLGAVIAAMIGAGLEPENILREYGPQQFEVTMKPAQGLGAANRAVILRDLVRDLARQFSVNACFSPILDPTSSGSGVHVHFSLVDQSGKSVTADPASAGGVSARAKSFVAGVLRHMPALCALTAPSMISYARLTPHRWSAGFNCFGYRNREAGIRICPVNDSPGKSTSEQTHFEFRAADATASPYMVLGALVRAGLEGLRNNLLAPPIVEGDPADLGNEDLKRLNIRRLPTSLEEAMAELNADTTVKSWLLPRMQDGYFALKAAEMKQVGALEDKDRYELYARYY